MIGPVYWNNLPNNLRHEHRKHHYSHARNTSDFTSHSIKLLQKSSLSLLHIGYFQILYFNSHCLIDCLIAYLNFCRQGPV